MTELYLGPCVNGSEERKRGRCLSLAEPCSESDELLYLGNIRDLDHLGLFPTLILQIEKLKL